MIVLAGSWPFFRLLVYDDGVEIRIMFQRIFVPYAEVDEISLEKVEILIRSDLPGAPTRIRFIGLSSEKIHAAIKSRLL